MIIHHIKPYEGTCEECIYFAAHDEPDDLRCVCDCEYTEHDWTCQRGSYIDKEKEQDRYVTLEQWRERI